MSWLQRIRQKPHEQKIRLIWLGVAVSIVILTALWIILARFQRQLPKDTTLFDALNQGFKNVKDNYNK